jgi:phage tail-like protein
MATNANPVGAFRFEVSLAGSPVTVASFSEVSGLDAEVQTIDYRCGDEPPVMHKLQGLLKYPNIMMKRGILSTPNVDFFNWLSLTLGDPPGTAGSRINGSITLLDETGSPVMKWSFVNGWACKVSGPSLKSDSNAVAIESLEIAHEGITISTP